MKPGFFIVFCSKKVGRRFQDIGSFKGYYIVNAVGIGLGTRR